MKIETDKKTYWTRIAVFTVLTVVAIILSAEFVSSPLLFFLGCTAVWFSVKYLLEAVKAKTVAEEKNGKLVLYPFGQKTETIRKKSVSKLQVEGGKVFLYSDDISHPQKVAILKTDQADKLKGLVHA